MSLLIVDGTLSSLSKSPCNLCGSLLKQYADGRKTFSVRAPLGVLHFKTSTAKAKKKINLKTVFSDQSCLNNPDLMVVLWALMWLCKKLYKNVSVQLWCRIVLLQSACGAIWEAVANWKADVVPGSYCKKEKYMLIYFIYKAPLLQLRVLHLLFIKN